MAHTDLRCEYVVFHGHANVQVARMLNRGREQREQVESTGQGSQRRHDNDGTPSRTQQVPFQRMKDDNPPFAGEAHNGPGRQKTAHVCAVSDRLTPAVFVQNLNSDPSKPDEEDEDEENVIDGGQKCEIKTGTLPVEARCADIDEERDGITDNTDEDDDWKNVFVQLLDLIL